MVQYGQLEIAGYRGQPLPNTFVRQASPARRLGILLPGVAYTADMPLLYYTRAALLDRGADTLSIEVNYARLPGYGSAAPEEQYRWLAADASAACTAALSQGAYERVTLVGKSLGTLALGHLVTHERQLAGAGCIWLTPLLGQDRLYEQIEAARPRSLLVAGGADAAHDPDRQAALAATLGAASLVVDGANHSLEVAGNLMASLQALRQVIAAVQQVLADER